MGLYSLIQNLCKVLENTILSGYFSRKRQCSHHIGTRDSWYYLWQTPPIQRPFLLLYEWYRTQLQSKMILQNCMQSISEYVGGLLNGLFNVGLSTSRVFDNAKKGKDQLPSSKRLEILVSCTFFLQKGHFTLLQWVTFIYITFLPDVWYTWGLPPPT